MIHVAGELMGDGVQRCVRCGYVLTDYRTPDEQRSLIGARPLIGWKPGAWVEVTFTVAYLTREAPDCVTIQ